MYLSRIRLNVTCTASGATVDSEPIQSGLLYAIRYTRASASGYATGATCDFTAVALASAPDIAVTHDLLKFTGTSASQILYPRREMQTTAGASAGAMGGAMIPLVGDRIRVTIGTGGASGKGTFDVLIDGMI